MRNYLEFETEIKHLEQQLEKLKDPFGNEGLTEVDKGDMDNDGIDEPDDEEYMDNKDKAIKKAISKEAVGDSNNMDQVDRPKAPKRRLNK